MCLASIRHSARTRTLHITAMWANSTCSAVPPRGSSVHLPGPGRRRRHPAPPSTSWCAFHEGSRPAMHLWGSGLGIGGSLLGLWSRISRIHIVACIGDSGNCTQGTTKGSPGCNSVYGLPTSLGGAFEALLPDESVHGHRAEGLKQNVYLVNHPHHPQKLNGPIKPDLAPSNKSISLSNSPSHSLRLEPLTMVLPCGDSCFGW